MWRLLTRYTRKSPIPCKQHDTTKFPNILANELCTSCESEICYICGNHHIEKGCFVRSILSYNTLQPPKYPPNPDPTCLRPNMIESQSTNTS